MKIRTLLCTAGLAAASIAIAQAQVPVNISYPISGGSYTNYFTSKFDVTCSGGPYTVKWGFDSTTLGSSSYYDHFSGQFGYKLPSGPHTFFVSTTCGSDSVSFQVL